MPPPRQPEISDGRSSVPESLGAVPRGSTLPPHTILQSSDLCFPSVSLIKKLLSDPDETGRSQARPQEFSWHLVSDCSPASGPPEDNSPDLFQLWTMRQSLHQVADALGSDLTSC